MTTDPQRQQGYYTYTKFIHSARSTQVGIYTKTTQDYNTLSKFTGLLYPSVYILKLSTLPLASGPSMLPLRWEPMVRSGRPFIRAPAPALYP